MKYKVQDYYLRDPNIGSEERERFTADRQIPGAIAVDRSYPAEGHCDFDPDDSQPSFVSCPVGRGKIWIPVRDGVTS